MLPWTKKVAVGSPDSPASPINAANSGRRIGEQPPHANGHRLQAAHDLAQATKKADGIKVGRLTRAA